MKNNKRSINRGIIVMNKGERIAVISLLVIIAILMAFSVFRPALRFSDKDLAAFHNLDSLIALQEEAKRQQAAITSGPAPVDEKDVIPMSTAPKKKLSQTSVPPAAPSQKNPTKPSTPKIPTLELNSTDSMALVDLPQIGEVMASRIQRYRDRLGGYVCYEQLYEVKGMDSARFATVRPYLLLDTIGIRKLEVNRDAFKTLLRHPYLGYDQVKAIVNYRERKGLIRNWEQLQGIVGEVNPLLEQYIAY